MYSLISRSLPARQPGVRFIVTGKYLLRQGVDPDDNSNWANNDEDNADWIG